MDSAARCEHTVLGGTTMRTAARWWMLAILVAGLFGCSEHFPPAGSPWPEAGTVKPGPFDPHNPGPGTTTRKDSRVPDRAARDAGPADSTLSPDHLTCLTGSCPANQLCFERRSPISAICVDMLPNCNTCDCMNPFPSCQCTPPPGPMIICPF
jgi:hypothetical protein